MNHFSLTPSSLLSSTGLSMSSSGIPFARDEELTHEQRELLSVLLDRYLAAMENGETLSLDELTADCPELKTTLAECVSGLQALHDMAAIAKQDLLPGKTVLPLSLGAELSQDFELGDFILHEVIGQGGMGIVYRATQKSLHRIVALKVLPTAKAITESQMLRFQREAELAASLQHPNIIPVYAVGFEAGLHYYAMQRIDGYSLDHREAMSSRGASNQFGSLGSDVSEDRSGNQLPAVDTDWREVIRFGIQAADGLYAAHEAGIVHRDIKPSNLLVNREGKLWIADFGLARVSNDSSLTRSGDLVGTMRYMSPEQARGNAATVDGRSDIYSLGATLYELLAGKPAFDSNDTVALLRAIDQDEPVSLRKYRRDIPLSLVAVLRKAMSKRRDDRYDTAYAFRKELQRVLDNKVTEAKMPGVIDRLQGILVRNRQAATAAALAMFMLILGLGINNARLQSLQTTVNKNLEIVGKSEAIARDTVHALGTQIAEDLAHVPGAQAARRKLLEGTLGYYERLAEIAEDRAMLEPNVAKTYRMIGGLRLELGQNEMAVKAMEAARNILRDHMQHGMVSSELKMEFAISLQDLARAHSAVGQLVESRREYEEAIALESELWREGYEAILPELATSHNNIGLLLSSMNDSAAAIKHFKQAVRVLEGSRGNELLMASIQANMVSLLVESAPEEVYEVANQALGVLESELVKFPTDSSLVIKVTNTLIAKGLAHCKNQEYQQGIGFFSKCHKVLNQSLELMPNDRRLEQQLFITLNHLGIAYCQMKDLSNGSFYLELAAQRLRDVLKTFRDDPGALKQLSQVLHNLANCYRQTGDTERLERVLREARGYRSQLMALENSAYGSESANVLPVSLASPEETLD